MDFLANIYQKTIAENEKNLRFWKEYVRNLKSMDFRAFSDKLKVPVLVPIGNRILFRGELKHTNEVTVALGADYFTKCSLQQAEVLRQHRIKNAESKLETFRKEREYLDKQVTFNQQNVFQQQGHEILEVHTEEEDKAWRQMHRERMRLWKQKGEDKSEREGINDEELWERLEELELQEELENELTREDGESIHREKRDSFGIEQESTSNEPIIDKQNITPAKQISYVDTVPKSTGKFDLLQKVIDKQNELEDRLTQIRNKDRKRSKTEEDLIAKLDEMEELDELEDEMERLEDIIETEDIESEEEETSNSSKSQAADIKRRVSFATEAEDNTLELTFKHSDVEPCKEPYDPEKGITKPSDIYEAYSKFNAETTSILKKSSKYEEKGLDIDIPKVDCKKEVSWPDEEVSRTITVKDVIEKSGAIEDKVENDGKRTSLFKQRRLQQKKL